MFIKLIKSSFLLLSLALLTNLLTSPLAAASTSTSMIYPNPNNNGINFFGQSHSYSVTFRGNGEAVVLLRATFSNLESSSTNMLEFRTPRVIPKDIMAFQVVRESTCLRYAYPLPVDQPLNQNEMIPPSPPVCEQYDEPNFFDTYSYSSSQKYQKATVDYQGDTLKVILPREVRSNASGSIILYYRALGYAQKSLLGVYDFTFESLKINDRIKDLQVGISTDSDLYLKGAKGTVNYNFTNQLGGMETFSMKSAAIASPQVDNVYRSIGQGTISKTSSNLQPLDSYTVKGSYASSKMMLYSAEVFKVILVILAFVIFIVLLFKMLFRSLKTKSVPVSQDTDIKNVQVKEVQVMEKMTDQNAIAGSIFISFVSSFMVLLYTLFVYFIPSKILSGSYLYEMSGFIILFLVIVSIAVYIILLVGPAIFMSVKKGLGWGLATFGLMIAWLIIYILVIFIILFAFGTSKPQIMY